MKANETDLIKDSSTRQLTAKGYKLEQDFIRRAAEVNNTSIYAAGFKEKKEKMRKIFRTLVFERNATFAQLSDLLKKMKK